MEMGYKIYKIYSYDDDKIYIGSTTQPLYKRLGCHKSTYIHFQKKQTKYISSVEILKNPTHKIELIELFPCDTKEELVKREGYYIKKLDCVNKRIAGRSKKEYIEDNKESYDQWHRDYYKKNKTETLEKGAVKYKCECGTMATVGHITRHVKSIQHCQHFNLPYTKPKKSNRIIVKYTCGCGSTITTLKKARHERSNKHIEYIKTNI